MLLLEFAIIESKNQRDEQYNYGNYLRDKVKHYYYLQLKRHDDDDDEHQCNYYIHHFLLVVAREVNKKEVNKKELKMGLLIKTACVDTILELPGTARIAAPP